MNVKLYKFKSLITESDVYRVNRILQTELFWCSKFSELNDPMEGVFYAREDIGLIYSGKNNYKICSFSGEKGFKELLMWGYYAGGFRGLAIEIEVKKNEVEKVKYLPDILNLEKLEGEVKDKIKKILTTKLNPWISEREYRFLYTPKNPEEPEKREFKIGRITAVYFGNPYYNVENKDQIFDNNKNLAEYHRFKDDVKETAERKGIHYSDVEIVGNKVKISKSIGKNSCVEK